MIIAAAGTHTTPNGTILHVFPAPTVKYSNEFKIQIARLLLRKGKGKSSWKIRQLIFEVAVSKHQSKMKQKKQTNNIYIS